MTMILTIFLPRMFAGQKSLFIVMLILGMTVLLALMFYHEQLNSISEDDIVRLLGAHHDSQTAKNDDINNNRRDGIVVPLPGLDVSTGLVEHLSQNIQVPVDPNVPELNAQVFTEQAYGNVALRNLHLPTKKVDPNVPESSVQASDSPTERTHAAQAIGSQRGSIGYVFSVTYWEQLASGSCNIMSLQCWAGKLTPPMLVLQPFYWDGWPRSLPYMINVVTFSDVFDIDRWNNVSLADHYAPLTNWKQYRQHAPRDLIVVKIIYWWLNTSNGTGLDKNARLESGCEDELFRLEDPFFAYFLIVRKVCINLSYGDILTLEEFNAHIFGHYNPGSVSVVFKEWRGISARNKFRVILNDSNCEWHYVPIRRSWSPSSKVKAAATQYIERFLGNGEYVALMMRLEWALRGRNTSYLQDMMSRVLRRLKDVQERVGTDTTFLAADIGKFGSATVQVSSLLSESFSAFFDQLYDGSKSALEWEKSFKQVSGTEDRDFVAMLQATVVSHAKCVIFVGHGNFQKHTKYMYEDAHTSELTPCVEHIH